MRIINIVLITFLGFLFIEALFSCAQVVAPTGGKKDTLAPKLVMSIPANQSKNYKGKSIEIQFDEYINVDNLQQQLLITPSMEPFFTTKTMSRGVRITFEDAFQPNTTYSFNFREAIKDITERNPAKNVRIVFSTGGVIDSLSIEGNVEDIIENKGLLDATVGVYRYSDTLKINKMKPYYFTKTDSTGNFRIENVAEGKYRIYAITDVNSNLLYDETKEKIGFITDTLQLSKSVSGLKIKVAKADNSPVKVSKTRTTTNYYYVELNKGIKKVDIKFENPQDSIPYQLVEKNMVRVYNLKKVSQDTIKIAMTVVDSLDRKFDFKQKIKFKAKGKKEDSFVEEFKYEVSPQNNQQVDLKEVGYTIKFSKPIGTFDWKKIKILNDTLKKVDILEKHFSWNVDKTEVLLKIPEAPKPKEFLSLEIPINTFQSIEGDTNKIVKQLNPLRDPENYGLIEGLINNPKGKQCIVQILNDKKEVIRELIHTKTGKYTFDFLTPGIYSIRLIVDSNKNGRWDMANVDKNITGEEILHIKDKIKLKQNFELSGFDFKIDDN
ncbi:Ig-like domain-containing domain [Flectobacillus longus]|uniref:Ig-like domain-containing domain n=1 Tax=Flectobacillus longus TaxID=2984207 RepID=UPI0024B6FDA5|nr:Ig-like domain-containing domain [Flectobacillus longus]MDI9879041.1 Ig-like domain-containing domain [Flectobacillus longus]